jgi:hypothetical protein
MLLPKVTLKVLKCLLFHCVLQPFVLFACLKYCIMIELVIYTLCIKVFC